MIRTTHQRWWWGLVGCLLCSFTTTAWAQPLDLGNFLGGKKARPPKAEITAQITPGVVRPGDDVTVAITVKLPDGYYIYGTERSFDGRTRIDVRAEGLEPLGSDFAPDHPGKTLLDPDLEQEVTKFYDAVTWSRQFRVRVGATGDTVKATGTLQGQYCSAPEAGGQCIPIRPPFEFALTAKLESATKPSASAPATYAQLLRPKRPSRGAMAPDPVEFELRLSPPNASRGDKVTLFVTAWLDASWHTYSLTQQGIGAAPTEIELDTVRNLKPLGDGFQADRPFVSVTSENTVLEEHHDRVTWNRKFEVTAEQPGDYGVEGTLSYVVCDARSCLPLKAVEFAVGQIVTPPPTDSEPEASPFGVASVENEAQIPVEEPIRAAPQNAADPAVAAPGAAEPVPKAQEDLLQFLLLCIVGGFLALLTPCSFPMVPITVSFFLKQSELQHKRPWLLALVYCGTIALAFAVLGVGVSAIFGAAGLNQLANNPWLNLALAIVIILFAVNMLGGFEIHIPSQWLTWSASHEGTGGYLGAVFMAITFTLTSFTCTFAVAGTLLIAASQGEVYRPVLGMLAFGAAFALPFFVLALIPGQLKHLPKSGGWMNSVKVVLGLVEIGFAIKFLSVADLAWNPQPMFFDFVTVMMMWMILALATGFYLLGLYRFVHDTPLQSISTLRGLLALSFLGFAGLVGFLILKPDAAAGWLMNHIIAFAPPQVKTIDTDVGPTVEHHGLRFALDLDRAIPVATQQERPLLLDFTGVNCINCRRMEKKMAEPQNRQRIEQFLAVQLYTDKVPAITDALVAEQMRLKNIRLQAHWFGDVTLPSYAVVTPDGKTVLAMHIGYDAAGRDFTQFLETGLQKWRMTKLAALGKNGAVVVER